MLAHRDANNIPSVREFPVIACIVVLLVLMLNVAWFLQDHTLWSWDVAVYGDHTVQLWIARHTGIVSWFREMAHSIEFKPPLIVWVGQFFLPIRHLTGNIESALLLVNVLWAALVLIIVYQVVRDLGATSTDSSAAVVACGGSGIFVGLTHIYLVEMTQCATVAIMLYAAWRVEQRPILQAVSVVASATALSLLSKSTSILFVIPLLCYVGLALTLGRRKRTRSLRFWDWPISLGSLALVASCFEWYKVNWSKMIIHFNASTLGDAALNYGSPVVIGEKLRYWIYWLGLSFSSFKVISVSIAVLVLIGLTLGVVRLLNSGNGKKAALAVDSGVLFALTLAGTVAATVLTFCFQINEDTRYLISTTPMIAILIGFALSLLKSPAVTILFTAAFIFNAVVNYAYSFGSNPLNILPYNYLVQINRSSVQNDLVRRVVQETCHKDNYDRLNIVAVDYIWLNSYALSYFSEKEQLNGGISCRYSNLGWMQSDLKRGFDIIAATDPAYVISVVPNRQPPPDFLNRISRPVAEALALDRSFELEKAIDNQVLIYRRR